MVDNSKVSGSFALGCADDFKIGFKAGVEWVAKQYKDAPWNEFVDMIINERQKGK